MRLKSAFSGFAALVLGLSLSPAFAATLVVDNFSNLGPIPSSSNNQWFYGPASGTLQNARDLSKTNGNAFKWGSDPNGLKLTATGASNNNLNLDYDGNVGGASNKFFSPRVDLSAFGTGWLNVQTPTFAVQSSTKAIASITWFSAATAGTRTTSTLTLNGGPTSGVYSFKLSDFVVSMSNLAYVGSINIRLQGLGTGTTVIQSINFSAPPPLPPTAIPEPGSLALAGLGLLGLVIAHRKKRA